jgi:hypothetical protein
MDAEARTSCWGWTFKALALFGFALACIYLFGGFDAAPVVTAG